VKLSIAFIYLILILLSPQTTIRAASSHEQLIAAK
jgi:hypothetical protein